MITRLSNMPVTGKLGLAFGVVICVVAAAGIGNAGFMNDVGRSMNASTQAFQVVDRINALQQAATQQESDRKSVV